MMPRQERLVQLARLIGRDVFAELFGPPQSAQPDASALGALVGERMDDIAAALVEEAAASDDVTNAASALAYVDDRLATLGDLITAQQSAGLREAFAEATAGW